MTQFSHLSTPRFLLRSLRPGDVTEAYSGWFDDPEIATYIVAAHKAHDVATLRGYVEERIGRDDVLFLGIFTLDSAKHIGNIKYEPIDRHKGFAVMGILIGDSEWRGKGVAQEVIGSSAKWLQAHYGIHEFRLGVNKEHRAAIAAYEKIGFKIVPDIAPVAEDVHYMVWQLTQR